MQVLIQGLLLNCSAHVCMNWYKMSQVISLLHFITQFWTVSYDVSSSVSCTLQYIFIILLSYNNLTLTYDLWTFVFWSDSCLSWLWLHSWSGWWDLRHWLPSFGLGQCRLIYRLLIGHDFSGHFSYYTHLRLRKSWALVEL